MLEVDSVRAGYGQAQALWDVSLRVDDGEIITIIGPNGAGKSTLVNVIAGIHPAWGGRIAFDGIEILCTVAPRMPWFPRGGSLIDMTVSDNLLSAVLSGCPRHREPTTSASATSSPSPGGDQLPAASGGGQQISPAGPSAKRACYSWTASSAAPVIVDTIEILSASAERRCWWSNRTWSGVGTGVTGLCPRAGSHCGRPQPTCSTTGQRTATGVNLPRGPDGSAVTRRVVAGR